VEHARDKGLSERWACRLLHQPRGTQRYQPTQRQEEGRLTQAIIALACQYGRYGYATTSTMTGATPPSVIPNRTAAARERSMIRDFTNGPRSLIRTTTL